MSELDRLTARLGVAIRRDNKQEIAKLRAAIRALQARDAAPRWDVSAEAANLQRHIPSARVLVIGGAVASGLALLGGLVALAAKKSSSGAAGAPAGAGAAELSPLRQKALDLVAGVVPSKYGDAKFSELAPGYKPTNPGLPAGFTTCGYLVCYVAIRLGMKGMIARCGTNGVKQAGQTAGAWVDAGGSRRPLPGDFYCLVNDLGGVIHVGVIEDASGPVWKTADAGQGSHTEQEALYVQRTYDPVALTLGDGPNKKKLGGWDDLDLLLKGTVN